MDDPRARRAAAAVAASRVTALLRSRTHASRTATAAAAPPAEPAARPTPPAAPTACPDGCGTSHKLCGKRAPSAVPDAVDDLLHCPVCTRVNAEPVCVCRNAHLLCFDCNVDWRGQGKGTCPCCRSRLVEGGGEGVLARRMLSTLHGVRECEDGCGAALAYEDIPSHRLECPLASHACPDCACDLPVADMPSHQERVHDACRGTSTLLFGDDFFSSLSRSAYHLHPEGERHLRIDPASTAWSGSPRLPRTLSRNLWRWETTRAEVTISEASGMARGVTVLLELEGTCVRVRMFIAWDAQGVGSLYVCALTLGTRDDLHLTVNLCMCRASADGVESQSHMQYRLPVRSLFRRGLPVKMKDALPSVVASPRKYCRLSLSASRLTGFDPIRVE